MACSPEQSRLNGAKTRGATSERGKAISARNATRHGAMAKHPPLLATEDLSSFEGMMQSLIEQFQPKGAIEHMLIQQVAMGWLRLHRLWGAESAAANLQVLRAIEKAKYHREENSLFQPQKNGWQQAIEHERDCFENFTFQAEDHAGLPMPVTPSATKSWLSAAHSFINELEFDAVRLYPNFADRNASSDFWRRSREVKALFLDEDEKYLKGVDVGLIRDALAELTDCAKARMTELDAALAEFRQHKEAIAQAEIGSKGLLNPDLYGRYETHIQGQLSQALDRLERIQAMRSEQNEPIED